MIKPSKLPTVDGLKFRYFQGKEDFPKMLPVLIASSNADDRRYTGTTAEEISRQYDHLTNSNPFEDVLLAKTDEELVAYARCYWEQEMGEDEPLLYRCVTYISPKWREKGLGKSIIQWSEQRLREIAATHDDKFPKYFEAGAYDSEHYWINLFEQSGYEPERYFQEMKCPNLDNIPHFSLVDGVEVRPSLPEHYRAIWDSDQEAFQDHWGFVPPTEEDYQDWLSDKQTFQPELWQVAWDIEKGEIAGQVRSFINAEWNEKYNCQQGYVDNVSVRRPWRRRGIARALLVRSLRQLKEKGMTEAELNVDSENPNGATRLYQDCGFQVERCSTLYRKPL